jgi:hypothetical protein
MKVLYLDMDGVVADFEQYAYSVLGHTSNDGKWHYDKWATLRDNPRMYQNLAKTKDADQLVTACKIIANTYKFDLVFLTAVPKKNDIKWAFYDKVKWAQFYYPELPVMFGPYSHDKQLHCCPGDVLIDDRTINVSQWNAVGGIGILHTCVESTLAKLNLQFP